MKSYKQTTDFSSVKPGDVVIRMLGGEIAMPLNVGKVENGVIYTGSPDGSINVEEGWKFDQESGAEIDELLGWGPPPKKTGSFLAYIKEK
jgi:hypothetical protein